MTALFGDVRRKDDIIPEKDTLGGFQRLESGIYDFVVDMAYAVQADSGAKGVAFTLVDSAGQTFRETMYVTSGTEKGGTNYYERDGRRQYLMGFTLANDICIAIAGKELADMAGTEKDVPVTVWIDDKPEEQIQKKQVLMDLIGGRISIGIIKALEDGYPDANTSRERNSVDKVFTHGSRMTIVEKEAGLTEGVFYLKWLERNENKLVDKRKKSKNSTQATAGAPATSGAPAGSGAAPSLFNEA